MLCFTEGLFVLHMKDLIIQLPNEQETEEHIASESKEMPDLPVRLAEEQEIEGSLKK